MEKSKLGISLNLFAALLYFVGATGSGVIPVLIAAGYILIFEESEKLKRTAVKAFILIVFFSVLTSLTNWLSSVLGSLFYTLATISRSTNYIAVENIYDSAKFTVADLLQTIGSVISSISSVIYICIALIMIIFGFKACRQIDVKIKWIDKILDKHFLS